MYSDKDFQTFWFRYKTEGEPHGIWTLTFKMVCLSSILLDKMKGKD